jgi:hypothetical protein
MSQEKTMNDEPEDRVIWRADLCKQLHVCTETVRRYIKAKRLPEPDVNLSRKTTGWRLSTLRAAGVNVV